LKPLKYLPHFVTFAFVLAICVVMLGAYTRLTDAGLGCPDWPGCYGRMVLPSGGEALKEAQSTFPSTPISAPKAWTEMVHRYLAGTLGLLLVGIAIQVLRLSRRGYTLPWKYPLLLLVVVVFQALLGMWTVTLKLLPAVVMGHLLGGMLIVALLARFRLALCKEEDCGNSALKFWVRLGVVLVFCQIALGGWVSSNYAGIACIGFPRCNGLWLPNLHLMEGFNIFSTLGVNYQGGVLDNEVRVTIQFVHRLGAVVVFLYVLSLVAYILTTIRLKPLRILAILCGLLVCVQCLLGILNVQYLLPITLAVLHNGVAALLLASMVSLLHFSKGRVTHGS
jgi:cytochrome c oxidase assembly protein subunit 15